MASTTPSDKSERAKSLIGNRTAEAKRKKRMKKVTKRAKTDPFWERNLKLRPHWCLLSDSQRMLVDEYCIDLDVRRASIVSGYTYFSAVQMLRNPLGDAVAETLKIRFENCGIKGESVLTDLAIVRDKCLGRIPVRTHALLGLDGKPQRDEHGNVLVTEEFDWDPAGANKALENIGRYLRLFTDTVVLKSHEQEMKEVWESAQRLGHDGRAREIVEAKVVGGLPVLRRDLPQDSHEDR